MTLSLQEPINLSLLVVTKQFLHAAEQAYALTERKVCVTVAPETSCVNTVRLCPALRVLRSCTCIANLSIQQLSKGLQLQWLAKDLEETSIV